MVALVPTQRESKKCKSICIHSYLLRVLHLFYFNSPELNEREMLYVLTARLICITMVRVFRARLWRALSVWEAGRSAPIVGFINI